MDDVMYHEESIQLFWADSSKHDLPMHWVLIGVLTALTNAPFVLILALNKKARTPTLINIAAADLVALLCLPLHYTHHFDDEWTLGPTMCTAFLILRDISAAVQSFSCLMLSVVNYKKVNNRVSSAHTTSTYLKKVNISRQIPGFLQIFVVWFLAIFVSILLAALPEETCSVHLNNKLIFEESSTIHLIRIRCLVFSIVPISITLIFLLLAAFLKSITPNNIRVKNHEQYLLLGFVLLLVINKVSGHIVLLRTLSLYPQVAKMFIDYSLHFPTYATAFMLPFLVYYTGPKARLHFNST
jgi:heme/copper-type cytochrome/quinol oxidase subunit 4